MKYSKALDFVLAAIEFQQAGNYVKAAKALSIAAASPEIETVQAKLCAMQARAYEAAKLETAKAAKPASRETALAKALQEIAAAKKKKKPMPAFLKKKIGVKAKKKAKAGFGDDEFDSVVDDMTEVADDMGGDLVLEDLEDTMMDGDDEGVEEMPLASDGPDLDGEGVSDMDFLGDEEIVESSDESDDEESDEDDDKEEASDEESDDEEEEKDDEEEKKEESSTKRPTSNAVSRLSRATANLNALDRHQKTAKRK